MNPEIVKQLVINNLEKVKYDFRYLHAHPELSYREFGTATYVQQALQAMNIPFRANIGGNGIVARIDGNGAGHVIALRADMDALPVKEATDLPYKSENDGVMHACGHDAHTACLLGVAHIINELKNNFAGTVLLVFQPGEEQSPGGADLMLQDGIFAEAEPELILAQHVSIDFPTGTLAFREGRIMASADEVHVKIHGRGGHGALPHKINDTVYAAAQVIVEIQQIASRLCPPLTPITLSFGKFIANGATNLIPDEVQLAGSLRLLDEHWRETAKEHIRRIIAKTAEANGCTADIDLPAGYPCVDNDPIITQQAQSFAAELPNVKIDRLEVRMTAEDFGFFTQKYPSCYFRFGVKGAANAHCGELHSATFQIDEDALFYGVLGMSWLALRFLEE